MDKNIGLVMHELEGFVSWKQKFIRLTCFPGWNGDAELSVLLLEKIFLF